VHSQRVLLALTQAGVSRERAYTLVQRNAMPVWQSLHAGAAAGGRPDFLALLLADADVRATMDEPSLRACFDLGHHLKAVDAVFARVFG
jgi:adenylosuccinate lyase